MTFENDKKNFLTKQDKSKKGSIDTRVKPLLNIINSSLQYYTTSSCSGRVYFWQGTGKKNEMKWVTVSHELITSAFFNLPPIPGTVWLRFEPFILHVCCHDISSAHTFLNLARTIFKKSALVAMGKKYLVEVRGSEFLEMPFLQEGKLVFSGDLSWLKNWINSQLEQNWEKMKKFEKEIEKES